MAVNTPFELMAYYANLLILQYRGKPKAYQTISTMVSQAILPQTTVQEITFSDVAASGSFVLTYQFSSVTIAWDNPTNIIQTILTGIPGFVDITVSGSIASKSLVITFTGVLPPVPLLIISSNTLETSSSAAIDISIVQTDVTLPLAIQNAFNLTGENPAQGEQLQWLGKYVGVVNTYNNVTLTDAQFLTLIRFAIVQNNNGSSLQDIQNVMKQFFAGDYILIDYSNMRLSYIFNSNLVDATLLNILINEGFLPKPMAVSATVLITPTIDQYFGCSTYDALNTLAQPLNTYDSWDSSKKILTYDDVIVG